ncbi:MAG: energy transducer TonB [Nitrospirae bacterium]|nr:energy transducer TonB [Nitrospirota bacterium]
MNIRQNIFASIMIHTVLFVSIAVVGKRTGDTVFRVPTDNLIVSLFREETIVLSPHPNPLPQGERGQHIIPSPLPSRAKGEGLLYPSPPVMGEHLFYSPPLTGGDRGEGEKIFSGKNKTFAQASTEQYAGLISGQTNSVEPALSAGSSTDGTPSTSLYSLIRLAIEKAKTYPFLARKKRIEGTVVAEFSIDVKGDPQSIKIRKSSGSEILDSAALNIIKKAAPLPSADGDIVVPITFSLMETVGTQ